MSLRSEFLAVGLLLTALIISFQNCSGVNPEILSASSNGGNGEPYSGKPETYYSYAEGFTCKDASGVDVPSPIMVIQKVGSLYKVTQEACVSKENVIAGTDIIVNSENQTIDYDFRRFQPAVSVSFFTQSQYLFVESRCLETLESRLQREYGQVALSPDEMKQAKADEVEVLVQSNYEGLRFALVKIKKDAPVQSASLVQTDSVSYFIADLTLELGTHSLEYLTVSNEFHMTAAHPSAIPLDLKVNYQGEMSMNKGGVSLSNVKLTCNIYPHSF